MHIDFSSFQAVLNWVIQNGYPLMFLAMCIEGPTVTAAATFAVTLGYFNPWAVFFLSLLGDILPDIVYYLIGYWGSLGFVRKIGKRFGISEQRFQKMEDHIVRHGGKTVAVLKYTPVLATPGLMLVGALRMKWWKYLWWVFIVTLQKTATFMLLGYFFGKTYNIGKYIKIGAIVPFIIVILYLLFAYLYKKYSVKITDRIEKL